MSHIYPCFVTNICHYFYLLDEICGNIHAVTYHNVYCGGKKQHILFLIGYN